MVGYLRASKFNFHYPKKIVGSQILAQGISSTALENQENCLQNFTFLYTPLHENL